MSNNISIRHLRAFIEVAACGSFTRAARNLHLTQSTLTATIKQLEDQAGLKLLDRTTRRVLLSGQGEAFLPVAEKLLSDFDTAFSDLQATASHQQGKVGVAASPSMISRILPEIIKHYHQQYPGIGIYLRDDNAGGIERRVLENEVDFGLGGNHSNQPELNYQPVLRDRYGVVLASDHPLAGSARLCWQQIAGLPQIQLTADTGTRSQLLKLQQANNLELNLPEALIEVSTPAGLAEMVRAGLGIALLPALAASTSAFTGLNFIPLSDPELQRQICIISRQGRALSPAAESLLQLIGQSFTDMGLPHHVSLSHGAVFRD
ncbi:LysR family transcriptional regulator [Neptuniibacter halophilus]|uniref:LysR family transcriptional regulator n=1 Tax=Neptuniibacter halophilus TaxID=651666 RepID=UPI002573FC98|nr:LysR family transcriptional regulator [Neptuniibacter halophilus]